MVKLGIYHGLAGVIPTVFLWLGWILYNVQLVEMYSGPSKLRVFTSHSTARVISGQALNIATCGNQTQTEVTACD